MAGWCASSRRSARCGPEMNVPVAAKIPLAQNGEDPALAARPSSTRQSAALHGSTAVTFPESPPKGGGRHRRRHHVRGVAAGRRRGTPPPRRRASKATRSRRGRAARRQDGRQALQSPTPSPRPGDRAAEVPSTARAPPACRGAEQLPRIAAGLKQEGRRQTPRAVGRPHFWPAFVGSYAHWMWHGPRLGDPPVLYGPPSSSRSVGGAGGPRGAAFARLSAPLNPRSSPRLRFFLPILRPKEAWTKNGFVFPFCPRFLCYGGLIAFAPTRLLIVCPPM